MKSLLRLLVAIAAAASMQGALANDQRQYEIRVGRELATLFKSLDHNQDTQVSREEARGDVNWVPLFDDIDVNRNGLVTREELRGYLELRYGPHSSMEFLILQQV
jgi:hypothetical protein